MKILYLQDKFGTGGINKITSVKENYLVDKGFDIHNLNVLDKECVPRKGLYSEKINFHSISIDRLTRLRNIPVIGRILRFVYLCFRLLKLYREIRPDIIVSTMPRLEPMLVVWLTNHIARIQEFHGWYNSVNQLSLSEEKEMQRRMKYYHLVALTQREANHIEQLLHHKCLNIPNATFLHPSTYSTCTNKQVLILARFDPQKGIATFLRNWLKVQDMHPDWELNLVGDGPDKEKLKQEIKKHNLRTVHILPYTLHPSEQYLASSIFLLPSVFEGWPLVIIESMAYGVPVIAYDCPCGPSEIIQSGVDGFVTEYRNPEAMIEKILYLIEHPDVRIAMGNKAKKNIQRFNIDDIMERWIKLFKQLSCEAGHQ